MLFRHLLVAASIISSMLISTHAAVAASIHIVAAENFYADIARQIGGDRVTVTSILSNPDDNPHLFEASPKVAKAISQAQIIIYSGAGYDDWMSKLLTRKTSLKPINVADLIAREPGDNPHIWYDPHTMLTLSLALKQSLIEQDPTHQSTYSQNWKKLVHSFHPLLARIDHLEQIYSGTPVTATEPVFGYMFAALGMKVRNLPFQMAVMNDTEPSVSQVKHFEDDLIHRRVKFLLYNNQVSDPSTERLKQLANKHQVPIVGATETMPKGLHYQEWISQELDAVQQALGKHS
jgi:zinc/manganese transport system substrate-binding protein